MYIHVANRRVNIWDLKVCLCRELLCTLLGVSFVGGSTYYTELLHIFCVMTCYAGNWVGKVVSDMKTRVEDPDNTMRLYLYSAVRRSL